MKNSFTIYLHHLPRLKRAYHSLNQTNPKLILTYSHTINKEVDSYQDIRFA